ncbi:MAG: hypothetical protein Q8N28_03405 [bacterium]|nr:hypothetical protein [bacterium]
MKINWIDGELKKFVERKNILFVTAQFTDKSSDIDIYCVVKKGLKSQIHIYKKNNYWIEIFIDVWEDMARKIENYDEIAVSFISRMDLVAHLSNDIYYRKALQLIKAKYKLPIKRKELLQYRIKVLASKYFSAIDSKNRNFFIGQLLPYLALAVFEKYGIWPESPKRWIYQLEQIKKPESKQILRVLKGDAKLDNLVKIFTSDFKEMHLVKDKKNNKITYLG